MYPLALSGTVGRPCYHWCCALPQLPACLLSWSSPALAAPSYQDRENWGGKTDYSNTRNTGGAATEGRGCEEESPTLYACSEEDVYWAVLIPQNGQEELWDNLWLPCTSGKHPRRRKGVRSYLLLQQPVGMQSGQVASHSTGLLLLWIHLWFLSSDLLAASHLPTTGLDLIRGIQPLPQGRPKQEA